MSRSVRVPDLLKMRRQGERIAVVTAYDYTFARLIDAAGADVVLVGDSLGNVMLGLENTLPVTLDEILYHTKAVGRGVSRALLVSDLPFMSYQIGVRDALAAAGRVLKETPARAVKLEGGRAQQETIAALTAAGIPVMGHVGLTPQHYHAFGGFKVQGRDEESAQRVLDDARAVEEAGAFSIVLEGVPADLAREITDALRIPTIGIGAGPHCSGQVLVMHDLLGLTPSDAPMPKFVKRYAALGDQVREAVGRYVGEVRNGSFPEEAHSYQAAAKRER